jgi:hypothetical protein
MLGDGLRPALYGLTLWARRERRSSTPDPADALWNPAARSGDFRVCGCVAANCGGPGLPGSRMEGVTDRSDAGIAK